MSSVGSLGAAAAYSNAAMGKIDLGVTLTKMAFQADNNMAGLLDKLVQQGMQSGGSAPAGMGNSVDVKA